VNWKQFASNLQVPKMNSKLLEILKKLALTVKKTIDEGISNGSIQPQDEPYFRWKVERFQYTDKGITGHSARGEYFTKKSWVRAIINLEESLKHCSEYASALEHLANVFGKSDRLSSILDNFVRKLIHQHLYDLKTKETDINSVIATFLKDLREEPVKYGARVEVQGVVLHPDKIEPSFGITLRQTKIEDLEREVPVYSFTPRRSLPDPSAIMNIEFLGRGPAEIRKNVEKAITILRLFKVGSVVWTTYHMYSESIMGFGTLTSGRRTTALETYLVTQEDIQKLKNFWETMSDSIPTSFFDMGVTKTDYLTIAYKRYSDALLENGLIERRIANAVMGLEAVFLKTGEIQELPYRLGLRISKLFGSLEHNPHEVKRVINDSYKVRNLFAHGGQLGNKRKKRLESKYKDVKNLLLSVLDYLRISIIVTILSKKEKGKFIDLVDDSLIDAKSEKQLNCVVSQAKGVIAS